jgi:hypothetical protein
LKPYVVHRKSIDSLVILEKKNLLYLSLHPKEPYQLWLHWLGLYVYILSSYLPSSLVPIIAVISDVGSIMGPVFNSVWEIVNHGPKLIVEEELEVENDISMWSSKK